MTNNDKVREAFGVWALGNLPPSDRDDFSRMVFKAGYQAAYAQRQDEVDALRGALERQCDNMSFILNRAELYNWHDKFAQELAEDRQALTQHQDKQQKD